MKLDAPEIHSIPKPSIPRVQKKRNRFWWVWLLLVLALVAGAAYWTYNHFASQTTQTEAKSTAGRPTPVVTAKATVGQMDIYLDGLGTVTSLNTVTLRSRVDGQIEKVAFTEGQLVHENDLLVQIDPRPYQVQLEQAQGQLAKDQAAYDVAKKNVARDAGAKDAISAQQLDTDTATMEQAQGSIAVDQGQIDSAKLQLTYCRITSPITGRIGLRLVDVGNIIHAADTTGLVVINQVQPISVIFKLSESDIRGVLRKVHSGPPLPVEIDSPDRTTKLATGILLATDSQFDPTSGTLSFKAVIPNTDDALFPNQFVNARLLVNTLRQAILVPKEAVQLSPDSTYVYVVNGDNTVEMRTITAGPTAGEQTTVTSGLSAGEIVVIDGVDKLQDKSKVTPRASATSQPATQASARTGGGRRGNHSTTRPAGTDTQPQ